MTIAELVKHMMPGGSRSSTRGGWSQYPLWPPDVFAVAATIVERSQAFSAVLAPGCPLRHRPTRQRIKQIAEAWSNDGWLHADTYSGEKQHLQSLWTTIVECKERVTASPLPSTPGEWQAAALELMAIADCACAGMGFYKEKGRQNWIQRSYLARNLERTRIKPSEIERRAPHTACERVPDGVACVLPKTRTPRVGCTLRSMTHHLALLPPAGVVRAYWNSLPTQHHRSHVFNVMVIPFPYHVRGTSFKRCTQLLRNGDRSEQGLFEVVQTWLDDDTREAFPGFVVRLIRQAQLEVGHVDGLVLPELALDGRSYQTLIEQLVATPDVEVQFAVAGVLGRRSRNGSSFSNSAITTVFSENCRKVALVSLQRKHHRWKLDRAQIAQYSLGDALDPQHEWWESAEVSDRSMAFYTFRKGACFTTLVCEDLARSDPGQHVIRAIGPNLVIALLMDGPQLVGRWPGQYAMGLAEDPGSSVLSVTSLGLIVRSNHHYGTDAREVALWRDNGGNARPLRLPRGAQALVLSLTQHRSTEYTLDGRSDGASAYQWHLSGCLPTALRGSDCPPWAKT